MRDVRGRAKLKRIKSRFSILSLGAVVTLTAAVGLIRSFSTHPLKLEETTDSPGFVVPQLPSEFQKPFSLAKKAARMLDSWTVLKCTSTPIGRGGGIAESHS